MMMSPLKSICWNMAFVWRLMISAAVTPLYLYLVELPISFIKIEGWMIRNMQHNDRILSMVKSVVLLAQTLGMTTIAECVEDARTAEILRDMGVDWGQGYYFGYPIIEQFDTNTVAHTT